MRADAYRSSAQLVFDLYSSTSSDQLKHQYDDRNNQKNMNEASHRLTGEPKTEGPQNQKNDNNCPKHNFVSPFTNRKMVDE